MIVVSALLSVRPAAAWDNADLEHGRYSVPTAQLVTSAVSGRTLFIDTREPAEFAELHVPGAINMPVRDTDKADIARLSAYDYVVPYCLKDLRAFEVAKALQARGLGNVKLMEPSGLRGWQAQKLPVVTPQLNEAAAAQALKDAAAQRGWLPLARYSAP